MEKDCVNEKNFINERKKQILQALSTIPKKILSLQGRENITEFVLHDLSHENCFNLKKAAYFVNNPDFNCLKGVAGVSSAEIPKNLWKDIWNQHEMFSAYMRNSAFNKKVRELAQCSLKIDQKLDDDQVQSISKHLGIDNPSYYSLDVKHGNNGLFIFEKDAHIDNGLKEHLWDGVSLLGFCPIF